jgi:hypothetical protein
MRARLALLSAGIRCELREVALAQKPQSLLVASPKGTVPVLVLPNRVIDQSLDIMLWALQQHDPQAWLPKDPQQLNDTFALVNLFDDEFKYHLDRYKYPSRYQLTDGLTHREAGEQWLRQIDDKLQAQPYLNGQHWGLADAALAPFVRQFAQVDRAWFNALAFTAVNAWLTAFEGSEAYEQCMHKYKVWHPDHKPVAYPNS